MDDVTVDTKVIARVNLVIGLDSKLEHTSETKEIMATFSKEVQDAVRKADDALYSILQNQKNPDTPTPVEEQSQTPYNAAETKVIKAVSDCDCDGCKVIKKLMNSDYSDLKAPQVAEILFSLSDDFKDRVGTDGMVALKKKILQCTLYHIAREARS